MQEARKVNMLSYASRFYAVSDRNGKFSGRTYIPRSWSRLDEIWICFLHKTALAVARTEASEKSVCRVGSLKCIIHYE